MFVMSWDGINPAAHRCQGRCAPTLTSIQDLFHRPWHLYRINSNPTHDKHQWLLLQFIMLLMTEAKGVRNM